MHKQVEYGQLNNKRKTAKQMKDETAPAKKPRQTKDATKTVKLSWIPCKAAAESCTKRREQDCVRQSGRIMDYGKTCLWKQKAKEMLRKTPTLAD